MSTLSQAQEYLGILEAYAPEEAQEISARERAGIDITDELYEALCVHDELAAEGFLAGQPARCQLCGETRDGDMAEMYDPASPDTPAVQCHALCGLEKGMVIA